MLRFTVLAADGSHTITLAPEVASTDAHPHHKQGHHQSTIAATFDGVDENIDVVAIGPVTYSVLYKGKSFIVDLEQKSVDQPIFVRIGGETFSLTVSRGDVGKGAHRENASDGESIVAPIPGRVVRVLAEVGKTVVAGAPLAIIEAMKMENVLTSRSGGTVGKVLVEAGQTVEAGQLLVVVEHQQRPNVVKAKAGHPPDADANAPSAAKTTK